MKKLVNYFLKGLVIFVPMALTVFVFVWAFTSFDSVFENRDWLPVYFPGLGILLTVALIFLIGFLASNFLGKRLFALAEKVFTGLPLVKLLYSAVKDMIEAFAGDKKSFDKPVIATIGPGGSVKIVGFVTRESLDNLGLEDHLAVYMPQSYNFAGNVLVLPKEAVKPLDIESSQAMAFVVSGGVSCGSA